MIIKLRKIFFYFIPWMGRKFWQKVTNGTGTLVSAGKTLLKVILYVPKNVGLFLLEIHQYYKKSLKNDPLILKILLTMLGTIVLAAAGMVGTLLVAAASRGTILPNLGNIITYVLKFVIIYNIVVWLLIAYEAFEQEQAQMLEDLSDD
jgi:hypothetical protein